MANLDPERSALAELIARIDLHLQRHARRELVRALALLRAALDEIESPVPLADAKELRA
jgi:hypothetical protein